MTTIQKLSRLPIFRHEATHKYFCEKSNKWLKYSTTQVCSDLDEEAKKNIERLRHIWQPRGEIVHYCLEQRMLGADETLIDMDVYEEWVIPLFRLELFTHFIPMGVEYMMSNPDKDLGGQLDLIGYDTKAKKIRLIDLKTKGDTKYDFKKKTGWIEPYRTDKQLGCYIEMLKLNCDIEPDICNTIWAYKGKCMLNEDQPVQRCLDAWQEAWEKFEAKQVVF